MDLMHNKGVPLHEIAKEPTVSLISCPHTLVAEHITFDVYVGFAIHGFLIAANSSSYLLFRYYK